MSGLWSALLRTGRRGRGYHSEFLLLEVTREEPVTGRANVLLAQHGKLDEIFDGRDIGGLDPPLVHHVTVVGHSLVRVMDDLTEPGLLVSANLRRVRPLGGLEEAGPLLVAGSVSEFVDLATMPGYERVLDGMPYMGWSAGSNMVS